MLGSESWEIRSNYCFSSRGGMHEKNSLYWRHSGKSVSLIGSNAPTVFNEKDLLPGWCFQEHIENDLCVSDRVPAFKLLSPLSMGKREARITAARRKRRLEEVGVMEQSASTLGTLKVVVVEDDATVRLFLKDTLEKLGHQVIGEAATGTDMVRTVLELEPDVVVFDIHLPRLNGLDALRQIYQERVVAAVAITADRDKELVRRALEEHVLAYLVKPVEEHQLGPALMIARAQFAELRELSQENASLRQALQNRKIIERAKGVLMKRYRWTEAEAFRRLQRGAMNRRTTMVELAQNVLNGIEMNL